jgi:hypothetical protein
MLPSVLRSPFSVLWMGAVAQLGERVLCKHEVAGSIPVSSTRDGGRRTEDGRWSCGSAARKVPKRAWFWTEPW